MARLVLLALVLALPGALAHGAEPGLDATLLANGEAVMVGRFEAPQPGPLVVVPFVHGAMGCGAPASEDYRISLGGDAGLMLRANATTLEALFDLPAGATGYAGFAVDTHDASRALILMQENAVALHALVGAVLRGNGTPEVRSGVLGMPYPLASEAGHDMGEAPGMLMDHDGSFPAGPWCAAGDGHVVLAFDRADLPDALAPGRVVHAAALLDPKLPHFLPRPIEGSTRALELNLYLARPGEDARALRDAFDPAPGPATLVPLLALALGLVWAGASAARAKK